MLLRQNLNIQHLKNKNYLLNKN